MHGVPFHQYEINENLKPVIEMNGMFWNISRHLYLIQDYCICKEIKSARSSNLEI